MNKDSKNFIKTTTVSLDHPMVVCVVGSGDASLAGVVAFPSIFSSNGH